MPRTELEPAVVLLSHTVWQRQFLGDPEVVGRRLRLSGGNSIDVVGVMGPEPRSRGRSSLRLIACAPSLTDMLCLMSQGRTAHLNLKSAWVGISELPIMDSW
jgi:hypothetical protein